MNFDDKTIFAPITLVGESGITVIRISGPDAFRITSSIFSKSKEEPVFLNAADLDSHTVNHGYVFDNGQLVDEVLISVFKSPSSFTGEDVTEISSHGGHLIFRKISKLLVSQGAVAAQPGDFSKRAFINGKMDLVQAEAIADLIRARTDSSRTLAMKQLSGEFSSKINELKTELINYCSLLELELDFSEEGIDLVSKNELLGRIDRLIEKFTRLTESYESGKIIRDGINLAIVGKPNVGKSSIFNYLLKENRAIVSDIPGTTRDYLEESLIMGGIRFNLIDTAGMRRTTDAIEKEGVARTHSKLEESDMVLEVYDLSSPAQAEVESKIIPQDKTIRVLNKVDLATGNGISGVKISAKTGENMAILQQMLVDKANSLIKSHDQAEIIVTNERHRACLLKSCEYLVNGRNQTISGGGNELISYEIRQAMNELNELTGKIENVDILNNIFSKFCIGK